MVRGSSEVCQFRCAELSNSRFPLFFPLNWRQSKGMLDDSEQLAMLVLRLHGAEWVALDTEADSLHAYPEKLCVLQLSFPGRDELVDPLAGIDLAPLWEALRRHTLILHGADYDLRLLQRAYKFGPREIFDTMEAARLLGLREFGLTHLVGAFLGVTLEKGPQKANWAKRPLTERMETYARNDTRYLKPLADILRAQLQEKGRLLWHRETCARLIANCAVSREIDPDRVWRVKGSHRLNRAGLAVLRELWHWREQEAVKANKPPYFILSHETLIVLADLAVRGELTQAAVPRRFSVHRQETLAKAVAQGLSLEPAAHPDFIRAVPRYPSESEKRRGSALRKRRDQIALDLGIDPTLIASRAALELLAQNWDVYQNELMHWQRELLAER
jgi:ribonuclease D